MIDWIYINDSFTKVGFQHGDYGLVTTIKCREIENTGYKTWFLINLSWFNKSKNDVIDILKRYNKISEIEEQYADIGEGQYPNQRYK